MFFFCMQLLFKMFSTLISFKDIKIGRKPVHMQNFKSSTATVIDLCFSMKKKMKKKMKKMKNL